MYIIHNSSSESTHLTNLGEGNFAAARVLANDQGHYFASGLQPNVYCIANQGEDHDYTGAVWLMNVLLDADCEGGMCQAIGRVPCNKDVEEQDWYKNDSEMMLYASYLEDDNYIQIQNPYWLTEFATFISDDMTADFQAVLMGTMAMFLVAVNMKERSYLLIASVFVIFAAVLYLTGVLNPYSVMIRKIKKELRRFPKVPSYTEWSKPANADEKDS